MKGGCSYQTPIFKHKVIHRYIWKRKDERCELKSMLDYIAMDKKLKKDVLDAKAV